MTASSARVDRSVRAVRDLGVVRAARHALAWMIVFIAFHVYWQAGGQFGFGDQTETVPAVDSPIKVLFSVVVTAMFAVGAALPLAFTTSWGARIPSRLRLCLAWTGGAILAGRGAVGLLDTALRASGLAELGVTGLSYEDITGDAQPSAYTIWSGTAIDTYFLAGGVLYVTVAQRFRRISSTKSPRQPSLPRRAHDDH